MPLTDAQRQAFLNRRAARTATRIQWYDKEFFRFVRLSMRQRMELAAMMLRDKVVENISRPVHKYKGPRSKRIQVDPASRSKPGEFPKADTTRLMKDIFHQVEPTGVSARVGTTLDYGAILETRMERSFLRRTLNEEMPMLRRILVGRSIT